MDFAITASIVAYKNDPQQLGSAIASVLNSSLPIRLYVVDNSPTSALRDLVVERSAEYIKNDRNSGFGAGHNIAFNAARGLSPYHLIVNPDVRFGPEVLAALKTFMDNHPGVGAVMPRILYPDGSEQRLCKLLPTPLDLVVRRFGREWIKAAFRKRLTRYELHDTDLSRARIVPSLSGCFLLVRTDILNKIGGFDERFFMYMEDVDLCRRIGTISETVYFPDVSVFHEYAKGSYHDPGLAKHHIRSALIYFQKWGWLFDSGRETLNQRVANRNVNLAESDPGNPTISR